MQLGQVVRVDVNSDGRQEVFLSISGNDGRPQEEIFRQKHYSYVLMRSTDRKGRVRTIQVASEKWPQYWFGIIGLSDLDHDGRVEVLTTGEGIDAADTTLFHFNGHRFIRVGGHGWGC